MLEDRFTVRPVSAGDGKLLQHVFGDPAVAGWLRPRGEQGGFALEDSEHKAEADAAHWLVHEFGPWLVLDGDLPVAHGGLGLRILRGRAEVEVTWAVRADRWGQGIATALGRDALDLARDMGIRGVVAFTRVDNVRSERVMERLELVAQDEFAHAGHPHILYRAPA